MPTGEEKFLIASPQRVFDAEALIASSEATPGMGVANLARYEPDEPWRAPSVASLVLKVKLRAPVAWNFVGLLYSSFGPSDTWRIKAGASEANVDGGSPTVNIGPLNGWGDAGYDSRLEYIHALHWLGAGTVHTHPWIRLEFTIGTAPFDLGVLVIDEAYQPPYHVRPGFTYGSNDFGTRRRTDAGKLRTSPGLKPRSHAYLLGMTYAEAMKRGNEISRRYGSTEPILAVYDPSDAVNRQDLMIYGALRAEEGDVVDEGPDHMSKRIVVDEIL